MNHSQYYRTNSAYAEFLSSISSEGYQKYIDHLQVGRGKVLDVGCGVGTVVKALASRGIDAYGIDPCEPAIEQARQGGGAFYVGEASDLPFADASFAAVGSFTVLEHVSEPEKVLQEMIRVLAPGGRIVIACPNFLRIFGLNAHHWHNRGLRQKSLNLAALLRKMWLARVRGDLMAFEHMPVVERESGFKPDDDAIIVTNALDIKYFLKPHVRITYHSGLVSYSGTRLDRLAELPLVRTMIGGVFLVGERIA